jgi:hypothetical protein
MGFMAADRAGLRFLTTRDGRLREVVLVLMGKEYRRGYFALQQEF